MTTSGKSAGRDGARAITEGRRIERSKQPPMRRVPTPLRRVATDGAVGGITTAPLKLKPLRALHEIGGTEEVATIVTGIHRTK